MIIKFLEWDSTFFNKKIGLLELNSDEQNFIIDKDYDLIYVVSDTEILIDIINFKNTYSETKVVFTKKLIKEDKTLDKNIIPILSNNPKTELYDLAFESGKYSRFNLDVNFKKSEFKDLYTTWVDNSFSKEFADTILVYNLQKISIGFVTYKVFDDHAKIGLIAVHPDYQGKGIGRKILEAVENELVSIGVKELRIPTQLQNVAACSFYHKMGYRILEEKIIKHYWKQ